LAGGSGYNYTLLSVIMLSNLMADPLQSLAIKLGVVTGRDLAQACRDHFSRKLSFAFWGFAEIAIAACDLAEDCHRSRHRGYGIVGRKGDRGPADLQPSHSQHAVKLRCLSIGDVHQ